MDPNEQLPDWLQTLRRFLRLRSLFLVHGNIYDQYLYPGDGDAHITVRSMRTLLQLFLRHQGYEMVVGYDVIDGLEIPGDEREAFLELTGQAPNSRLPSDIEPCLDMVRRVLSNRERPVAFLFDFASRLTTRPNELSPDESRTLLRLLKGVQETHVFHDRGGIRNVVICVCDQQNDLPSWLFFDNPLSRTISVPKPAKKDREYFIRAQRHRFCEEPSPVSEDEFRSHLTQFVDVTDGMSYRELDNLRAISQAESIPLSQAKTLSDLYRYGVQKSLWDELEPAKIHELEAALRRRVKGQNAAIERSGQIIKRAATGLTGINRSGSNNRPRGVMFFAGPTGVGKTELAKSIAEHIFGDESLLIRFDMSEYSHEHSDEKLLGSPPGYVGHDEGGQLTNRIKEKPFSVVLFDEIEKAHPKLFDKFLQILDDGRITDGKGETVYFSESVIVFTSNLGMNRRDEHGNVFPNVTYGMPYDEMRQRILAEIKLFFEKTLNRPELYNRFGENFVVFEFIEPEVGLAIMDHVLETVASNLLERKEIELAFSSAFRDHLFETQIRPDLSGGGRGIHNKIEEFLVNGLSSFLVEAGVDSGASLTVDVDEGDIRFELAS